MPSENLAAMNGLGRRIDQDSNVEEIRMAAAGDALLYGMGAYGFETKYVAESIDPGAKAEVGLFDQAIHAVRIEFPEWTLLWDTGSIREDKSDAEWCAHRTWMLRTEFERAYPNAKLDDAAFTSEMSGVNAGSRHGVTAGDLWYRTLDNEAQVAVIVYCRKVYTPAEAVMTGGEVVLRRAEDGDSSPGGEKDPLEDTESGKAAEGKKAEPEAKIGMHRKIDECRVERIVACGDYILDRTWVPGHVLPYVPVYGDYVESQEQGRVYRGLMWQLGDANKALENTVNEYAAIIAVSAKSPIALPEGAEDADPEAWANLCLLYTSPSPRD